VIFFPALTAGPIARIEGFVEHLRAKDTLRPSEALQGGQRILLGLIKKFVLADSLGLIALDATNIYHVQNPSWIWLLLYAYALQLYLDFSAYTDIAVGIGRLAGVCLPENFHRPYLQPNIRMFWNSWHITLAQWFRTYFFNPLTRRARHKAARIPESVLIFSMHLSTMALIGLWHGVKWNFLLWGIWHGLGLFIHNRWSAFLRRFPRIRGSRLLMGPASYALGVVLTFHFVVLGWVLFAFADLDTIGYTFQALFGWSRSPMTGG
jgi:D-alanyl-lipoteichoic acid acyltransferase DltB (MBOAT superfamily)